jgi:hypothetical protein
MSLRANLPHKRKVWMANEKQLATNQCDEPLLLEVGATVRRLNFFPAMRLSGQPRSQSSLRNICVAVVTPGTQSGLRSREVGGILVIITVGVLENCRRRNVNHDTIRDPMHRRPVTLIAVLFVLAIAACKPNRTPIVGGKPKTLSENSIASNGDLLLVPVTISGQQRLFCLDTGATITVFDDTLKNLLGKPVGRSTVNEAMIVERFQWPDMRLGDFKIQHDGEVISVDLSQIRRATGHEVYGIIGMDWLQNVVFETNFDEGKIRFLSLANLPGYTRSVPLEITDRRAFITAQVGVLGDSIFRLDTGCDHCGLLTSEDFAQLQMAEQLRPLGHAQLSSYRGTFDGHVGSLHAFRLGDYDHTQLVVYEGGERLLGLGTLSRHNILFDFPNKRLFLFQSKRFSEPESWVDCGLTFVRQSDKTKIESVKPDGPAASTGLLAGDEISSIQGKPSAELSLFELRRKFFSSDTPLDLTIQRGDREISLRLKRVHAK